MPFRPSLSEITPFFAACLGPGIGRSAFSATFTPTSPEPKRPLNRAAFLLLCKTLADSPLERRGNRQAKRLARLAEQVPCPVRLYRLLVGVIARAARWEKIPGNELGRTALHLIPVKNVVAERPLVKAQGVVRSEEHTSELQSLRHLVCRLL